MATGASYHSLAYTFRMGVTTVQGIVKCVCIALWNQLKDEYIPPITNEACHKLADKFRDRWNFPNVIGAVDGKHVRIQCPKNTGSKFFNYKKYFSIVLHAVAGPDYKFLFVDVGAFGSESDGGIFKDRN